MKHNNPIYPITLAILIFLLVLTGRGQCATAKEDIKTIAVLPFKVNASENLTYVREGILHMLYSRLSWRNNVVVDPAKTVKKYLSSMENISETKQISKIARLTHSDFVLAGTITSLAGSFSIDVQVYDIGNKRYMAFFEQSERPNDLINKVDRIAATINNKIFHRSTMTWEKMEQEKQAYIKEQKRKNPEYMMKDRGWQDTEQSPGWKIWKYLF